MTDVDKLIHTLLHLYPTGSGWYWQLCANDRHKLIDALRQQQQEIDQLTKELDGCLDRGDKVIAERDALQADNQRLRGALEETPIQVYCNTPDGNKLVARLSMVSDVKLFNEPYDNRVTWNMDSALEKTDESS